MNVLNFFTTLDTNPGSGNGPNICGPSLLECRGASSRIEFDRQRDKVLAALDGLDADVIGLMEIENNDSAIGSSRIVDGLNADLGAGTYAYIDTGTIGTDAIKVAFIYQPARVDAGRRLRDPRLDRRPALHRHPEPPGARADLRVEPRPAAGSRSSSTTSSPRARRATGDPDTGDGQGNCNLTRVAAAEALVDWLASDPTGSGDADASSSAISTRYAKEDPIDVFVDADYDDLIETVRRARRLLVRVRRSVGLSRPRPGARRASPPR